MTEPPAPQGPAFTWADVQNALAEQQAASERVLQEMREGHQVEMDALRRSLAGVTAASVPEHSGGPGTDTAETWSLAEQIASRDAAWAATAKLAANRT